MSGHLSIFIEYLPEQDESTPWVVSYLALPEEVSPYDVDYCRDKSQALDLAGDCASLREVQQKYDTVTILVDGDEHESFDYTCTHEWWATTTEGESECRFCGEFKLGEVTDASR